MFDKIPRQEKNILIWLLDLLELVVRNEEVNKMSCKNCSIVFGPNIFDASLCNLENPVEAVQLTNKAANFLEQLLLQRVHRNCKH